MEAVSVSQFCENLKECIDGGALIVSAVGGQYE